MRVNQATKINSHGYIIILAKSFFYQTNSELYHHAAHKLPNIASMMNRKTFIANAVVGLGVMAFTPGPAQTLVHSVKSDAFNPSLAKLRALAGVIVGELPTAINATKVADTIRPASVVVSGESEHRKMTLARTVYQFVYPQGTILLDSGMDLETHRTFGKTEEPFYPDNFERVNHALAAAKLIVFTHYHADHVAGVVRSPSFELLSQKTWVSTDTLQLMLTKPHKPTVRITASQAANFIAVDFDDYYPLAPGIVLFKAPGHTPDSKMLYIRLANGREFIHSVDSGWSMENIRGEKMKNASWVHEDESQLLQQYRWLNRIMATETHITVLCTHDNEQYKTFTANGTLGSTLAV